MKIIIVIVSSVIVLSSITANSMPISICQPFPAPMNFVLDPNFGSVGAGNMMPIGDLTTANLHDTNLFAFTNWVVRPGGTPSLTTTSITTGYSNSTIFVLPFASVVGGVWHSPYTGMRVFSQTNQSYVNNSMTNDGALYRSTVHYTNAFYLGLMRFGNSNNVGNNQGGDYINIGGAFFNLNETRAGVPTNKVQLENAVAVDATQTVGLGLPPGWYLVGFQGTNLANGSSTATNLWTYIWNPTNYTLLYKIGNTNNNQASVASIGMFRVDNHSNYEGTASYPCTLYSSMHLALGANAQQFPPQLRTQ